jgi:K+-sensing histidine kinase KdpD
MSRIEAGVLRIHPELTRLTPVVERALAAPACWPGASNHRFPRRPAGRHDRFDAYSAGPSNLLDNAAKYSLPGTPIHISVSSDAPARHRRRARSRGGISHEHAEQIFDRFYRIENAGIRSTGGIGLGLAISRG